MKQNNVLFLKSIFEKIDDVQDMERVAIVIIQELARAARMTMQQLAKEAETASIKTKKEKK